MENFQISDKIKNTRILNKLSTTQMAELLKVSENEYLGYEIDSSNITIAKIEAMAKIFNINPHLFFDTKQISDFNNFGEINGDNNGSGNNYEQGTVNNYGSNEKLEKLYEEKIEILENKNTMQLNMLNILNETILNLEQMQSKNTKK